MFSTKEKARAFDRIAERYYKRNFSTLSKTDMDTLMFDIYIEQLLDKGLPHDDYNMSKALGISQGRIRTFKVRKELQYPRENFNWVDAFAEDLKKASFDNESKKVKVLISDVNVLSELRYFVEKNGWYDEYQLNPRLFQCRIDFFIDMIQKLAEDEMSFDKEAKRKIKQLEKNLPDSKVKTAIQNILEGSVEEGAKKLLLYAGKTVGPELLGLLPIVGEPAKNVANALIEVLSKED